MTRVVALVIAALAACAGVARAEVTRVEIAKRADIGLSGPRRSIEERYPSREAYLERFEKAADALVLKGYLLIDDVPRLVQRASDMWDWIRER